MPELAGTFDFVWAGLVKQLQTGSMIPSQRFLIARMIAPVPEDYEGQILELGAGNGAITLPLAMRCRKARILACEINPTLARHNRQNVARAGLSDRVKIVSESAERLLADMAKKPNGKAEYIISGLPFGNMPGHRSVALIDAISESLRPGGTYVQFQYSLLHRKRIMARFKKLRTLPVLLNFPPAMVYYVKG